MITREQIAQLLKSISEAHYQIHSYGWGDVPDLLAREDVIYPFLMVTPSSSTYEEGYATHTYTISIADRVLKDKANEVNVDSDTHQILLDILSQIDNLMYDDVDVVKGGTITPFFDNFRHEVTGHFADVGIRVKFAYDSCAVPSDIVPLPLPPPFECADASYRVQYVNGTLIEEGTIASGGSKTINVPNPSICDPANYEVRDADGNILYSGTIASGGSESIVVTNSTVVVRKSDNTIISSVSVLAQGSANYQVADSVITLTDTDNSTLSTTNVKATDPATIVAPNGTLNVNKSDGALISGQVVKSGETKGYNVADSVVSNSDASYTANVKATDPLILPDQQINVNSVDRGDIPSVGTIDINITDGVNPVVPNNVGIVGRTVTVEVPSGGGAFNVGSVDRFGNTLPTIVVSADTTLNWGAYDFAQQYINALSFTPSATLEGAIIDLVDDLIGFGIWSKMRAIWLLNMGTAIDTALNLKYPFANKNSFQLTHFGSPTYDTDGIQYNTTTNHSYTHFDPAMLGNDNYHFGIYSQTNSLPTSAALDMGFDSIFTGIFARDNNADRSGYQLNGTTNVGGTNANSEGHYVANALGTAGKLVKNGSTVIASGTIATSQTFACLSINGRTIALNASTALKTGRKYSLAHVGEGLTDTEIGNLYTAIQTYHTTLGIQK